jgi:hypothetical protein
MLTDARPAWTGRPEAEGSMTTLTGSEYFFANSKSRWSCAGTPMTTPVPYPPRT